VGGVAIPSHKPKLEEKHWIPEMELKIQKIWEEEKLFKFNVDSPKPKFSIDTPPPYASGKWHMGAAIHYSQIDMIARTMRMKGYETFFPFGIDRNGLPVEVQAEKHYGVNMFDVPREKFIEMCKNFLDQAENDILSIAKRLGLSADFNNVYRTDSDLWRAVTQKTFIDAWKAGLVYEDLKPNNYCPRCRTTLADAEVEYEERETTLVYLKFHLEDGEELIIATTRPELLPACEALIFNPSDERYTALEGRYAFTPLGKKVPIHKHHYAKPEFGTGLVMVCSYGDRADVEVFRDLGLRPTVIIDENGRMTEKAGKYKGMTVEEAKEAMTRDLEEKGFVVKKERIVQRAPKCWRCGTTIEIIAMKEYYLKQKEFVEAIRKLAKEMKFHPDWSVQYLENWIDSIKTDWPISRRRYYGTEVPIWYCKSCGMPVLPPSGRYYKPWKEDPPFEKCPYCGSNEGFEGEKRVFDTWMDSSISPLVYNGYGWNKHLFEKLGSSSLRPQGKDIVRTWLFYTLLRVYQILKEPAFEHVWLSGLGLDPTGRAMHRHLGNVIYPWPFLEKYGADAVRMFGAMEAHHGSDYRISEDRIEGAFKFLQKLWNVARFISTFPVPEEQPSLTPTDLWILGETNKLIRAARKGYDVFDFFDPAVNIRHFVWEIFAPHYLEMIKHRAYGGEVSKEKQLAAWWTLHQVLQVILKLAAPIIPHITDFIWRKIYGGSVHTQLFPEPNLEWETKYANYGESIMNFNSMIWKEKKARNLPLTAPIGAEIPEELAPFKEDLIKLHNITTND